MFNPLKFLLILTCVHLSILYYGCSLPGNGELVEEVNFSRDSFDSISNVNVEILSFDTPLHPLIFDVIRDSLVLVQNWKGEPYYLALYDLKSKEVLFEFAKKGRGPGEWLSASISYQSTYDNGFVLRDVHTNDAAFFNIDSLLLLREAYSPQKYKIPDFTKGDIVVIDSCKWVCFNLFHIGSGQFANETRNCLYPIDVCNSQDFDDEIRKHQYFTHNITGGSIAVSPDKSRILVFYKHLNMIEIFNKDFELIKKLNGPEVFIPELNIRDPEFNSVGFKKRVETYGKCFYNQRFIYVIYKGKDGLEKSMPTEVFKLNWNGDLLHRYILSEEHDVELQNLYLDSNEQYLYGTVSNWKEYPQLVRFKLRNNTSQSED